MAGGIEDVQMVADGVVQAHKSAVMKESRLQCCVAQRRRPELVAVRWISGDLFQPKVFIPAWTVKDDVTLAHSELRCDLRYADDVHLEIAEHFIGLAGDLVAAYASRLAEEQDRALLFLGTHRVAIP